MAVAFDGFWGIMVANELEVHPMKALTYIEQVKFALMDKPKPTILDPKDSVHHHLLCDVPRE